jgi:hypothetical protein
MRGANADNEDVGLGNDLIEVASLRVADGDCGVMPLQQLGDRSSDNFAPALKEKENDHFKKLTILLRDLKMINCLHII